MSTIKSEFERLQEIREALDRGDVDAAKAIIDEYMTFIEQARQMHADMKRVGGRR